MFEKYMFGKKKWRKLSAQKCLILHIRVLIDYRLIAVGKIFVSVSLQHTLFTPAHLQLCGVSHCEFGGAMWLATSHTIFIPLTGWHTYKKNKLPWMRSFSCVQGIQNFLCERLRDNPESEHQRPECETRGITSFRSYKFHKPCRQQHRGMNCTTTFNLIYILVISHNCVCARLCNRKMISH